MELTKTLRGAAKRVADDKRYFAALVAAAGALSLLLLGDGQRRVALPLVVIASLAVFLVASLWGRGDDEPVPLFEIGTVYCAVLALYSLVPFLNYLLAGMTWTGLSDNRLLSLDASPEEVGRFAWNYVVYFLSFALVYLWARDKTAGQKRAAVISDSPPLVAIALPLGALMAYFLLLDAVWGVDANPSYTEFKANMLNVKRLPLLVLQVSSHLRGILLIFKMAMLLLLFERWESGRYRAALFVWLTVEVAYMILNMGARFETTLLLLCALLFYHRLVRPVKLLPALALGLLLVTGFQVAGMVRTYINRGERPVPSLTLQTLASATSEFQSIFATAYDLEQMKKGGRLGEVPAQLPFSDLLGPVPQQLLPFKKLEPSRWYLEVRGLPGDTGYMFGVIAQGVVGFGLFELALRGALVGLIFAWAQRWYARRSSLFLPTLFYTWLCVWSYYTFRASTFQLLSPIVYRVLPVAAFVYCCARLLNRLRPAGARPRHAL